MALVPGTRIGSYEIAARIGVGGMGEVYRARDTRLGRDVAIKVLPDAFAEDAERLARFDREARTLASLNHPGVAHIYGIEDTPAKGASQASSKAIVMELVEGPTLADRVADGPIPIDEALAIAKQIVEALDAAHARGIVHRDLKPANVKIAAGDRVKLLDFGLATGGSGSVDGIDASGAPTVARTVQGAVLGTPAYMSPEQARGHTIDARADLWSFGCVLYEMLTGVRPFAGPTTVDIVSAVLTSEPAWDRVPSSTPPAVRALLRGCLEKDAGRRTASAVQAGQQIADAARTGERGVGFQRAASASLPSEKSLLVLPFANQSPERDDEYFSDGLTEELLTDLSRVQGLRVVPSAATFRLKHTERALTDLAGEFKVRYVLSGRVRKLANDVRVNAQLVDVWSDRSVWADRYTGTLEDVFDLQERVSKAIAGSLELQLGPRTYEPSPEAREAYLKGRYFFRQTTGAGHQRALECFAEAVRLDPDYGAAFAGMAEAYITLTQGWDTLPARDTMPKAKAAAERAIALDPSLAEAHTAMGLVAMFYEWDLARAEQYFRRSLQLNPSYTPAYRWYASLLIWLDTRYDEALQQLNTGLRYDPTDPVLMVHRCYVHIFSWDFARAVEDARELTTREPLFSYGHYALAVALAFAGRSAEAVECCERGIALDGRGSHWVGVQGWIFAADGRVDEARACLEELDTQGRLGRDVAIWKLHTYAGLRDADQVLLCLDEAIEARSSSTVFVLVHPLTDFVFDDPRFADLLRKMGVEYLRDRRRLANRRPR